MVRREDENITVRCWPSWIIWFSIVWWAGVASVPWWAFPEMPSNGLKGDWRFGTLLFRGIPLGFLFYSLYALLAASIRADPTGIYYLRWNGWKRIPWAYVADWYTEERRHSAEGISWTDTILTVLYRNRVFRTSRLSITRFDDLQEALYQYGTKNAGALPPPSGL